MNEKLKLLSVQKIYLADGMLSKLLHPCVSQIESLGSAPGT